MLVLDLSAFSIYLPLSLYLNQQLTSIPQIPSIPQRNKYMRITSNEVNVKLCFNLNLNLQVNLNLNFILNLNLKSSVYTNYDQQASLILLLPTGLFSYNQPASLIMELIMTNWLP